ncbi:MAG: methyltransferase domain-containing protein [Chloroflexota bacterium]
MQTQTASPTTLRYTDLKTLYKKLYFMGFNNKCPMCKANLRKFIAFGFDFPVLQEQQVIGAGRREHAQCPICFSLDRERMIYLYLKKYTDVFERPQSILHVAPEYATKRVLEQQAHLDYTSADMEQKWGVKVQMDITKIQFPDETFDKIICNHVLEHVPDDRLAMSEFYRTMKPGGMAVLQVPLSLTLDETYEDFSITSASGREQEFGQSDHVRIYAKDYKDRLESVGFEVEVFDWKNDRDYFGGANNKYSLVVEEDLYIARKPL